MKLVQLPLVQVRQQKIKTMRYKFKPSHDHELNKENSDKRLEFRSDSDDK